MDQDPAQGESKADLKRSLERNRRDTVGCESDLADVEAKLATLPALEETLRRFKDAGLEERLADKDALIREEAILTTARVLAPGSGVLQRK